MFVLNKCDGFSRTNLHTDTAPDTTAFIERVDTVDYRMGGDVAGGYTSAAVNTKIFVYLYVVLRR